MYYINIDDLPGKCRTRSSDSATGVTIFQVLLNILRWNSSSSRQVPF